MVPTDSTGPSPAVERCGRDGGAAGLGLCWRVGGPAGVGEGRGSRRCAGSSRCAEASVLAGPEEGRAGPAWLRPQHMASSGPEPRRGSRALAPRFQAAGSTGVKVLPALAHGGRNRVLLVLALGEAEVTPRRPRSSLVPGP